MSAATRCGLLLLSVATLSGIVRADDELELLPADRPLTEVIDHHINEGYKLHKVQPADRIDDAAYLRRVTLDLAGRTPTAAETQRFLADGSPNKREVLVDRLLNSPDFAFHLSNEYDRQLLADIRNDREFREYLLSAVRQDRRWPIIFRDLMLGTDPDGKLSDEELAGARSFLRYRASSVDDMTNDTSRLFFGVSINCAKCHDHPLVGDWVQDNFYGMSAFFHRTYVTGSGYLAEKPYGKVSYKTVDGQSREKVDYLFLTGETVSEPDREWSKDEIKKIDEEIKKIQKDKKAGPPKPPAFSPRAEFVKLALTKSNRDWLARNFVNRTWARLVGTGLVDPPDQNHTANPASHPELLAWLTRDTIAHNYDTKRLIRGIVLSRVYALSSQWDRDDKQPGRWTFAVAPVRVLAPRQYALSLEIASRHPDYDPAEQSDGDWAKERENLEKASERLAGKLELPGSNYQVSVDEALLFTNGDGASSYLRNSSDRIVGALREIDDPNELVETAFLHILTRQPETEERDRFVGYLEDNADRRDEAINHLTWALLTGPELRFNH